jgi:hypothetical protein
VEVQKVATNIAVNAAWFTYKPVRLTLNKMKYSTWDAVKDFLGALGPILIAIPWLRDFFLRYRKKAVSEVPASGRLVHLRDAIVSSLREKIDSPKVADFMWTVVGLLLIFVSFLIAFIHGLGDLL